MNLAGAGNLRGEGLDERAEIDSDADAVSSPAPGDDRVGTELFAEVRDMNLEEVGEGVFLLVEEVFVELRAGQHGAPMEREIFEERELSRGEVDDFSLVENLSSRGVQRDGIPLESRGGGRCAPADECPDAGQEFVQIEGFDEVIVGTGIEATDAISSLIAGSEKEDRSGLLQGADFLEDLPSAEFGKEEVEDDDVVMGVQGFVEALTSISGLIDGIAFVPEAAQKACAQAGLVFDEQQSHGGSLDQKSREANCKVFMKS